MMKIVVDSMSLWSVVCGQWSVVSFIGEVRVFCVLLTPAHRSPLTAPVLHCSLLSIACPHDSLDISAHVKVAFDLQTQRIGGANKVLKNYVNYVLVENLYVPK